MTAECVECGAPFESVRGTVCCCDACRLQRRRRLKLASHHRKKLEKQIKPVRNAVIDSYLPVRNVRGTV